MAEIDTLYDVGKAVRSKGDELGVVDTLKKLLENATDQLSSGAGRKQLWEKLKQELSKNDVAKEALKLGLIGTAVGGTYGAFSSPKTKEEEYQGRVGRIADNAVKGGMLAAVGGGAYQIAKNTLL